MPFLIYSDDCTRNACYDNQVNFGNASREIKVYPINADEVGAQLKQMRGKIAGERGIVAEMLKWAYGSIMEATPPLFTDVIQPDAEPPDNWRKVRLKILCEKGGA